MSACFPIFDFGQIPPNLFVPPLGNDHLLQPQHVQQHFQPPLMSATGTGSPFTLINCGGMSEGEVPILLMPNPHFMCAQNKISNYYKKQFLNLIYTENSAKTTNNNKSHQRPWRDKQSSSMAQIFK